MWRWEAPAFQSVGYRVFSVSNPSGTTYEGHFTSGDMKTAKGRILSHDKKPSHLHTIFPIYYCVLFQLKESYNPAITHKYLDIQK